MALTTESPFAVANYFIGKAAATGVALTPMKLIKLVYIAHGWCLGLTGEALISESPQAWKYGPVIESLYGVYRRYGNGQIPASAAMPWAELRQSEKLTPLLSRVWDVYSQYTGGQLSTLTHQRGTPWDEVWNAQGGCDRRGAMIPDDLIRQHYRQLVKGDKSPDSVAHA